MRYRAAGSAAGFRSTDSTGWWIDGFPFLVFCILILWRVLTPVIQGGSRMRESRTYGFVRGVLGDRYPYRDSQTVSVKLSLPVISRFIRPAVVSVAQ